ncbi:MAG: hypothetical protein QSU88_08615, partial [Candidatus Methanoperedens sp.]|nr:hypothetical protein [Candidatus Methanoperedens sp.]
MHDDLKERVRKLGNNYNGKEFLSIVDKIKKDKLNDDELLMQIENLSRKRFKEKVSFTPGLFTGNLLEIIATIAAIVLAFRVNTDWVLYLCALILMATLHPLSHYLTGRLSGIRFTHYYLNGPARIEPTLRINYFSYLKAGGMKRALMHASGVIGTLAAPLIVALIALDRGALGVAMNLVYFFLLLIVFELLTSTRIGDLM